MSAGRSLPLVALAALAACYDASSITIPGSSTTASTASTSAETGTPTSTANPATTTAADPLTTSSAGGEASSGALPGDASTSDASTGDASTSDASTGEAPLPGCGDTPPADFDAVPAAPLDGAVVAAPMTDLEVTLGGQILADATAEFHVREVHTLTADDDFTIVVLPDTQNYTQFPGNFPQYPAQTKWIWEHRNTDNIVAVLHNGDVVQHGNIEEIEWERAETAMKTIEESTTKFPDGIPYGIAVGNHDNGAFNHDDKPFATTFFNKYFGVDRFKDRGYYGGHYGNKNDNNWIMVRAGNLDIVMVSLEYRGDLGQDPEVLQWAKGIFKDHPHALGIVNSHHIVKANGGFSGEGQQIYNVMKNVDNVQLMTSGHIKEIRARRTDTFEGRKIHSMLADYQDLIVPADDCAGGCGYMRIWRFSPMKNQLKVETFSPSLGKSMTGPQEQFTLTVDLSAVTGVFTTVGETVGHTPSLRYTLQGLTAGDKYEWYAVVSECGAKVTTPTRSFTVN